MLVKLCFRTVHLHIHFLLLGVSLAFVNCVKLFPWDIKFFTFGCHATLPTSFLACTDTSSFCTFVFRLLRDDFAANKLHDVPKDP